MQGCGSYRTLENFDHQTSYHKYYLYRNPSFGSNQIWLKNDQTENDYFPYLLFRPNQSWWKTFLAQPELMEDVLAQPELMEDVLAQPELVEELSKRFLSQVLLAARAIEGPVT